MRMAVVSGFEVQKQDAMDAMQNLCG